MQTFSGYNILKQVYSSEKISIYQCIRLNDRMQLFIKMLNAERPNQQDIASLKHEYNMIKDLDLPSVIHAYGLEQREHQYGLILEDVPEAYSLNELILGQEISIDKFLKLSIKLTQALHELHTAHIIHKDINPHNIIISEKNHSIKLINFGIATKLSQEIIDVKSPDILEGTFAYMSPEQTSRMNRAVDERSDLYSLGITFYEMLIGKVPFSATDPIGWVHCHIAKEPKPPHHIRKDIPKILSDIILKLLAKTPEDRYLSAYGLKNDLERCLLEWQTKLQIENFVLGENDRKSAFHIPEKLYGREAEVQTLLDAFERTNQGGRELLLVLGNPGIGKSSLVNEVHKPIVRQRGYFAAGKFEQFHHLPYDALIQAFRKLLQQILTESNDKVDAWRTQLSKALYPNGQIIIDVIPELELLIGKQPPVPPVPITESRNRFELLFFEFVRVFASAGHPLTIYLDDLQWADASTCSLLKEILRDKELDHFLMIGAYRDNEVSSDHPLLGLIEDVKKTNLHISTIQLKPLSLQDIINLTIDTLNTENNTEYLAKLIEEKTGGNPFFIKLFLNNLYHDRHIQFDIKNGQWIWDIKALKELAITDNIVDLVINNIERLPLHAQDILKIAACIGNRFDLNTLALIVDQTPKKVANVLWDAIKENLIIPINDNYKLVMVDNYYTKQKVAYKFSHDRIQQAAYSMLSESQRQILNLKIGRLLLEKLSEKEKSEQLFEIANHFNESMNLITESSEKIKIAELNYKAGLKAKHYAAYTIAEGYFKHGLSLLNDSALNTPQDLIFNLKLEYAESQYALAKFHEADKLFDALLEQTTLPIQKSKIILSQVLSYQMQTNYDKAIDLGLKGLRILGLDLPRYPNKLKVGMRFLKLHKNVLRNKTPEDFLNLPILEDPEKELVYNYIQSLAVALYVKNPNLYAIIAFYCIEYAIKYGNTPTTLSAYLSYAAVLSGQFNKHALAQRYGLMTIELAERFGNMQMLAITYSSVALLIAPWNVSYKTSLEYLIKSYHQSRQAGELLYANSTLSMIPVMMFSMGSQLKEIENRLKTTQDFIDYCNHQEMVEDYQLWNTMLPILCGNRGEKHKADLNLKVFNFLNNKIAFRQGLATAVYGICLLYVLYFIEDWSTALKIIDKIKRWMNAPEMKTLFCAADYYFYTTLIYTKVYRQASFYQRLKYKYFIRQSLKKFKYWSTLCPDNYQAKYFIMLSSVAAFVENDIDKTNTYYEKAADVAHKYDQTNLIGIANELMAQALLSRNQYMPAKSLLEEAIYAYQQWGAEIKVKTLQKFISKVSDSTSPQSVKKLDANALASITEFDVSSVLKSSQVISSQVKLENLLKTLIHIVLENAGAERGVVLLLRNEKLFIEAEGYASGKKDAILPHKVLNNESDLGLSIIQYVYNTKAPVVLDDATNQGQFTEDEYIARNKISSVFCIPIMQQGKLLGILYLENKLTKGAFTPQRYEVLKFLSSQMAISLENALLYTAYDQFVPHEFLDLLDKRSIIDIQLGDHIQKYMTIMFSDMRNFTKLSEKMGPNEVFLFINEFLGHMEPIIKKHHGFIDKYIGDAIMALFPGEATDAVQAGIEMQQELEKYNQQRQSIGKNRIEIGIGINSGSLMLGTLGSGHRLETSVLSDAVNLAARLEELTKEYGSQLLLSEVSFQQLSADQQKESRYVGKISIRGKEEKIGIWEVYSGESKEFRNAKNEIAEVYNEAINLFEQAKFSEALQKFEICKQKLSNDKVIKSHISKCLEALEK